LASGAGRAHTGRRTAGPIPFTPRAKQVLRLALAEALRFGRNYVGTVETPPGI
jgi:hypothetical protein